MPVGETVGRRPEDNNSKQEDAKPSAVAEGHDEEDHSPTRAVFKTEDEDVAPTSPPSSPPHGRGRRGTLPPEDDDRAPSGESILDLSSDNDNDNEAETKKNVKFPQEQKHVDPTVALGDDDDDDDDDGSVGAINDDDGEA